MIHRNAQPLAEILEEVLNTQHLKERLNEIDLVNSWPDIVGKSLAQQTEHLYIRNETLYLHVKSAIVRNELMLIRESLVDKLNTHVGSRVIKNIVLR